MDVRIFYVEDDETLAFITSDHLQLNGYQVDHFIDGKSALRGFDAGEYDICILDVMLPEMDGFELAEEIRKRNSDIPIIFLTARALKEDRIEGLKIGADDYISKPFSIEELLLKIKVFLKRSKVINNAVETNEYKLGQYTFDYDNLSLSHPKETKTLTQREADLLKFLISKKGKVIKRNKILEAIWGEDNYFMGRSLDVFISRLRKLLALDPGIQLLNIHSVGFKLVVPD